MQLGRPKLTPEEWQRRTEAKVCIYCSQLVSVVTKFMPTSKSGGTGGQARVKLTSTSVATYQQSRQFDFPSPC